MKVGRIWSLGLLTLVILIIVLTPNLRADSPVTKSPASYETAIHADGSAIRVEVKQRGTAYHFFLDTGSTYTILDSASFQRTLETASPSPPNSLGSRNNDRYFLNPGTLTVGTRLPIIPKSLRQMNLAQYSAAIGERVDGILGCDFLDDYVIDFNADSERLTIAKTLDNAGGLCVEFHRDRHARPTVRGTAPYLIWDGVAEEFLIDTGLIGFPGVTLRSELFEPLVKQGMLKPEGHGSVVRSDGIFIEREGQLRQFDFWSESHNIRVRERKSDQPNLLGLSFLWQFNFTIDFPNSKLYLRPRKIAQKLLHLRDYSGAGILRYGNDVTVARIDAQSPAAKAGILVGDIITSVNGIKVESLRLHSLRLLLCAEGKTIKLNMRRGERDWTVDLDLLDWRQPVSAKDFE